MTKKIFVPFIGAFGGVERLILSLSRSLTKREIQHRVVCFQNPLDLAKYADWPLQVDELQPARNVFSEARELRKYLGKCGSNAHDLLVFDLKGAFYASCANLKHFTLHLTDPPSLLATESSRASRAFQNWVNVRGTHSPKRRLVGEAVHRINRRGVRHAKKVVVMTNLISAEIQQLYDVAAIVVRPGVAEANDHSEFAGSSPVTHVHILSVSRLEESKRIDWAIDALKCLRTDERRTWSLEIIGAGPVRETLEQYVHTLDVADEVRFRGRVSDDELEASFQSSSIFVMPAVQGYGLPALEALNRRVPVVLHRDSGVSEILRDCPWVEIIEHSHELAPAIARLCERVDRHQLTEHNLPNVPTEDDWALKIFQACEWLV